MDHWSQKVFVVMGILYVMTLTFVTPTFVTARCRYGYEPPWKSEWFPERNYLLCCKTCKSENSGEFFNRTNYDKCSTCNSKTIWQFKEINLFIEYVSMLVKSLVLWQSPVDKEQVYTLKHPDTLDFNDPPSEMTDIPSNICNWDKDEILTSSFNDTFNKFKIFWNRIVLMDFSYNKIRRLGDLNCLHILDTLVLKHNKLTHLFNTSFSTLKYLRNVDVSYNQIKTIDIAVVSNLVSIKQFDLAHNQLTLFEISNLIDRNRFCQNISNNKITYFTFDVPVSKVNIITSYGPETAILASVILLMIIAATLVLHFKYEILVTILRYRQQQQNAINALSIHDVFISYDDENENLCQWVDSKLVSKLEAAAFKVFLTYRDLPLGDVRDLSTISAIKNSRNFLLILSDSYLRQEGRSWCDNEWKYGWNCFKTDRNKNIVIINYDHISSFDIDEPRIRAFLRVGIPIEFFNRERDIIQKVSIRLGTPIWNLKKKIMTWKIRKQSLLHVRCSKFEQMT